MGDIVRLRPNFRIVAGVCQGDRRVILAAQMQVAAEAFELADELWSRDPASAPKYLLRCLAKQGYENLRAEYETLGKPEGAA